VQNRPLLALSSANGRPQSSGTLPSACTFHGTGIARRLLMNAIIYLVGLVVVVMFILSLVGLR
jgi:hypothetical protein